MKFRIKLLILIMLTILLIGMLALCVQLDRTGLPKQKLPDHGAADTVVPGTICETTATSTEPSPPTESEMPTETAEPTITETPSTEATEETVPEATEAPKKPAVGTGSGGGTIESRPPATVPPFVTEPIATVPPTLPAENEDSGGEWGGGDIEF